MESSEPVSSAQEAVVGPVELIGYAITAAQTAKKLYDGLQWINCVGSGFCPQTDAQAAADRVILSVEGTVERLANDGLIGRLRALLDRSVRDFNDLSALGNMGSFGEEAALINEAEQVFEAYSQRLNGGDPTSQASAQALYALTPSYLVAAALLDNLARIELVRNQAPMTPEQINDYRHRTLLTLDAVVGTPNLWYNCTGNNLAQTVTDIHSFDHTFATRKVWKLFADYRFAANSFSNDCNLFRRATNTRICNHDCSGDFPICKAGVLASDASVYPFEIWKAVEKMKVDPIVASARDTMEKITSLTPTSASSPLWRLPTGELRAWSFLSDSSYEQLQVGNEDPTVWKTVGSGDFNKDGTGDLLWVNQLDGSHRVSTVTREGVITNTTPAFASRFGGTAFVGDLDGDGDADVAWTGTMSRPMQGNVYLNDIWIMNPGSSAPIASWRFQADQIQGIGDFDKDSFHTADLLFRSPETGWVSIQFNLGSTVTIGFAPLDWQIKGVGDFNGDGFADILWYNVNSGGVATWTLQGSTITNNVGLGSQDPASGYQIQGVGDLDHDGVSDIIWRHTSGSILLWHMAPTFQARDNWLSFTVGGTVAFGGMLEMGPPLPNNAPVNSLNTFVCGDQTGDFRNPGFAPTAYNRTATLTASKAVLAGDVNADGTTDLVGVDTNSVIVVQSNNGRPSANQTWRSTGFFGTRGTLLADVNGDKRADLIALGDTDVKVSLAGIGTFNNPTTWRFASFGSGRMPFAGDVTGDGKADLVAVLDTGIQVIRSTGSSFSAVETWKTGFFGGPKGMMIGDMTGDGKMDLVALQDNAIVVAASTGSAFNVFTAQNSGFWGKNGTLLGDVTGDGMADLVALEDDTVRVMKSMNGSGFGGAASNPFFRNYYVGGFWGNRGSFLGDIDANGKADLIVNSTGGISAVQSQ